MLCVFEAKGGKRVREKTNQTSSHARGSVCVIALDGLAEFLEKGVANKVPRRE